MEVYVIRHGESTANAEQRFSGWSQVPLTELGREQARRTGERLKGLVFDRIFSSDQLRARETTELVFPGREYTTDWRIRELNIGSVLEDRLRDEAVVEYGEVLTTAMVTRDFSPFGGENLTMHLERVSKFMDDLAAIPDDEQIAIVCHGGSILSMLSYVVGFEIKQTAVTVENASVTCFRRQDGKWRLLKWSDTGDVVCANGPAAKSYAN